MKPCTTHHYACDCREARSAELREAAQAVVDDAWGNGSGAYVISPIIFDALAAALEADDEWAHSKRIQGLVAENKALRENAEEDADTIIKLTKKYVALRKEAQAIVGFVDGPAETLRPDVFHLWLPFINRLRKAALLEEK